LTGAPRRPPRAGLDPHHTQAIVHGLIVAGYFAPVCIVLGIFLGLSGWAMAALLVLGPAAAGAFAGWMSAAVAERAGRAAQRLYAPTGDTTPYQRTFSYQEAMAMRGDVAGALESYEALITELRDDAAVRMAAAHLYATKGRDPARAAALYREARLVATATRATEFAATNALIDLYRGAPADEGRMLTELRRLAERFAGTPPGEHARAELEARRALRGGEGA